jgi:hypothetical protein
MAHHTSNIFSRLPVRSYDPKQKLKSEIRDTTHDTTTSPKPWAISEDEPSYSLNKYNSTELDLQNIFGTPEQATYVPRTDDSGYLPSLSYKSALSDSLKQNAASKIDEPESLTSSSRETFFNQLRE